MCLLHHHLAIPQKCIFLSWSSIFGYLSDVLNGGASLTASNKLMMHNDVNQSFLPNAVVISVERAVSTDSR